MKRPALIVIALFRAAAFAQDQPQIAVEPSSMAVTTIRHNTSGIADGQDSINATVNQMLADSADSLAPPDSATAQNPPEPEPALAAKAPQTAPDAGKPNIAVYVTGEAPEDEKRALGTRILASLVNSGRYRGVERNEVFLAEIDREMLKQRSGAIDDDQISELGKQFGVKFICIADFVPAYNAFQVSARIVNVETAEVMYIGEAFCLRKNALYITWVSENVVRTMFGQTPLPEPVDPSLIRISAGAGAFLPRETGGVTWGNGEQVAMPYTGIGAYLFIDATYIEAFAGYSAGGGKWESVNSNSENLPDMQRASLNAGVYAKYPLAHGGGANPFISAFILPFGV